MSLKALKDKFFGIRFLYKSILFILIFLSISFTFASISSAASSDTSYFQGKIVIKSDGTNISESNPSCVINGSANDTCDFRVEYYSATTSGDLLWQEDFLNVELGDNNGIFSLSLGTGANGTGDESSYKEVFKNNSDVYMQISFDTDGNGDFTDPEIFTVSGGDRMQIRGVQYAITSEYLSSSNTQFIKNQSGQQTSSSFNIDGNGTIAGLFTVGPSNILYVNGSTNMVGIGTTTPSQKLSLWDGNADIADSTVLGSESLNNGDLTSGIPWDRTNDCVLTSDAATCTYSAGLTSTIKQASGDLAVAGVGSRWYKFVYTISELSGTPTAFITTAFASETTALTLTAGTQTTYFKSSTTPTDFIITTTLTSAQAFTIDALSLTEVQGGNLALSGILTGGGTTGLKVLGNGNVGIGGMLDPAQALDVNGGIRLSSFANVTGGTAVVKNANGDLGVEGSDARLKKNIVTMQNSLDIIDAIRTVKFNWLSDADGAQQTIGVIAQDLLPILPEAVFNFIDPNDGNTYYGVHYEKLGVLALDGIKGLSSEISSIKTEIGAFNQMQTGDLWTVNNDNKLFSSRDVILGNVAAIGATINQIDTDKINALDVNITGVLTSEKIITKFIDARQDENIAVRLSEKMGITGFNVLDSEGNQVFGVNSLGDVNIKGKLTLSSEGSRRTSGTDNILAYEVRAIVSSDAITEKSKVFLSLTDNSEVFPVIKVSKTDVGFFEVMLDRILGMDTVFNWFIIN